jgi:imidazolonepropionase-like amidohydrolase
MYKFRGLAAAVIALATVTTTAQPAEILLRTTRWLDPESGALMNGPTVIRVADGRVSGIYTNAEPDRARTGSVIDLGAATVLPGLVDAHVHLQIGGDPEANATAALRAGFTTVVDLGATTDVVLRLRDRIASGALEGPRILAAGLWAGTRGGVCEFGGIGLTGPDAFRARVRENVQAGADLTKLCVSGWLAEAFQKPDAYEIDDASLAAAVEESKKAGRPVIAHAISPGSARAAARAGVNGLAHAALIDEALATELRERGVFIVPTLASLAGERTSPAAQALRQSVGIAHRAGVSIVFGTDGGVLPHGRNAEEFAAMVQAGVPPLAALRSATTQAAQALKLGKGTGQICLGCVADLIAVEGNPLKDIQALSRVVFVMRAGRIIRRPQ